MDILESTAKIHKIADHYGKHSQAGKMCEECAELIAATVKNEAGTDTKKHLAEEMADVAIMIIQNCYLQHIEDDVLWWINYKINRQLRRMENEK